MINVTTPHINACILYLSKSCITTHKESKGIKKCIDKLREVAQGQARYDLVRTLNVQQFSELFERRLKGERFDDMIDDLIQDMEA